MASSFRQRVVHSLLWLGGAQAVGQAASWLATLVVIRLLMPSDYGLMAMAMLVLSFLFMIADLGIGAAAIQAAELGRGELRAMSGMVLLTCGLGFLLTLLAAPLLSALFHEPRVTGIARVLAVNFLFMAVYILPQARLIRELDFAAKARVDVLTTVASAATSLGVALLGFGVWALVGGIVVQHATRAVLFQLARPTPLAPDFRQLWGSPLVRFGAVVSLDRILFFLYSNADIAIGGRVLGREMLGFYTVAATVAALPMEKVLPIVTQVSFAAFSRIQTEEERVRRNVLRALRLASLFGFPAFFGMAAVAPDLVPLLLGAHWQEALVPFRWLCLAVPLKMLSMLLPPALFGIGRPGVNLVNVLITFLVMSVALLLAVSFGIRGLSLAWVLVYPFVFVWTTARALRALRIAPRDFMAAVAPPALGSIVMLALVAGVGLALPGAAAPVRLGAQIATGVLGYGALALLGARGSVRELQILVRG